MKIIVLDGLLGSEDSSVLLPATPLWTGFIRGSEVHRVACSPESLFPQILGFKHDDGQIPAGPLWASAYKLNPGQRDLAYCLPAVSLDSEGKLHEVGSVSPELLRVVNECLKKLQTLRLFPIVGEGLNHVLIEENGSPYTETSSPSEITSYMESLPVGDNESSLRRLIEDSYEILHDVDENKKRLDQGLLPVNMLWPHNQGFSPHVPNLSLKRGYSLVAYSTNLEFRGLARLTGGIGISIPKLGQGMFPNWSALFEAAQSQQALIQTDFPRQARNHGRIDTLQKYWAELQERVLDPLLSANNEVVTLLALDEERKGFAVTWTPYKSGGHMLSELDERLIDDKRISFMDTQQLMDTVLSRPEPVD